MQTQPGAAEPAADGNAKGSPRLPQTHGLGCQQGCWGAGGQEYQGARILQMNFIQGVAF